MYPLRHTISILILVIVVVGLESGLYSKGACAAQSPDALLLSPAALGTYVEQFNADDDELYGNAIPNQDALAFLTKNVPRFECPDKAFERTFYFRWWTYRKHIKMTPDGYVVTEFLPKVPWSGKHNTISCPAAHHIYEGRWLHDTQIMNDYSAFWLTPGSTPRRYSFWIADAFYANHLVRPDRARLIGTLDGLIANYQAWEQSHRGDAPLFYQVGDRDGMEVSIGRSGHRATINSYMYGDAKAIAEIAILAGRKDLAKEFQAKAEAIKAQVQTRLWDRDAMFFKVLPRGNNQTLADVRELHGYTPWYFNLPEPGKGYEAAWKQLTDPKGFYASFGPTTAEQRHPGFTIAYKDHECQWNGPSWPMATSVTLTALANVLNNYRQDAVGKRAYFNTLNCYTRSHTLKRADGKVVPWIDENLNPYTGDWISRTRLKAWNYGTWSAGKGGKERGKDYNHSTYNDLIITGLAGLRPRADAVVEVNPLLPDDTWDYFCLDNVLYHGQILTILWDKTGDQYGKGPGLKVFSNGIKIAESATLSRVTGRME
jgi:hypothetical protein